MTFRVVGLPLAVLLCAASLSAQASGPGTFSIRTHFDTVGEPCCCPVGFVCENYAIVEVTRTGGTAGRVTVDPVDAGGTATPDVDYSIPQAPTLVFPDGSAEPMARWVVPIQDDLLEPNETVMFRLQNPTGGATIGSPSTATVTIRDTSALVARVPTLSSFGYGLMAALLALGGSLVLGVSRPR